MGHTEGSITHNHVHVKRNRGHQPPKKRAQGPVCYTHGGSYALSPHSRALTDEMMAVLAEVEALATRGVDEETMDKVAGRDFLRMLPEG